MKILGIESSCDETAAAIVENGERILSNVVHSQIDIHKVYGGVVPEVAARSHIEVVNPVINQALSEAGLSWSDIDAIAVTYAPGLIGSLLVGTLAARTLAVIKQKPLCAVHHIEAHIYANFLDTNDPTWRSPEFPILALVVSGGHTQLMLLHDHGDYELLGQTRDDAVGEAFDKVAKIIGLPYPGGPSIAQAALKGDSLAYKLPIPKVDGYDFSFSGLKTALLRSVQANVGVRFDFPSTQLASKLNDQQRNDFAASFQSVAVEALVEKTKKAFGEYQPKSVVIAGGVAANKVLRQKLAEALPIKIQYPPTYLCTDNAAMVASLGYFYARQKNFFNPLELEIFPSLSITKAIWQKDV